MALHQNVLALIWFQVRMMPIVGSRNRSGSSYVPIASAIPAGNP
jgi:hypothetical protein